MTLNDPWPLTAIIRRMLKNVIGCLNKASDHARQHGIDEAELLNARLAPDMLTMQQQIENVTTAVRGTVSRLLGAGPEHPEDLDYAVFNRGVGSRFKPPVSTFAELVSEVNAVIDLLSGDHSSALPTHSVTVQMDGQARNFDRQDFIVHYFLPNFYFHLSIAYGILRHCGVTLGKQDYEGVPVYQIKNVTSSRNP